MEEKIEQLANLIADKLSIYHKDLLSTDEATRLLNVSKSTLYKMTMRGDIPFFKPAGKLMYFERAALESWMRANRIASTDELQAAAANYCESRPLGSKQKGGKL